MRERDCVARLFVFCTFILMRRALYWICPRYVILLSHFSKRDQKESHFSPQKKKKKKKNLTLSSFPDLSSFFIEDTFSIALLLLLLLQRERERKREERERQSTKIRERVQRQPRSRRFEEKLLWDFFFKAEKQRDLIPRNDIIIFSP